MFETLNDLSRWFLENRWTVSIHSDITSDGRFNGQYISTAKSLYRNGQRVEDIDDISRVTIKHAVLDTEQALQHLKTVISLHDEITRFETILPVMPAVTISELDEVATQLVNDGWLWTFNVSNVGSKQPYYYMSVSTWHWAEYSIGGKVGFQRLCGLNEKEILSSLHSLAAIASQAREEFPDSIPYENIHGELKLDKLKTGLMFKKN